METKLYLENSAYVIPAVFNRPESGAKSPAVILCHGTGSDKDEVRGMFARLAELLEAEGIASIRMDFADCGERCGKGELLTFQGEVSDVECAYSFLLKQEDIDCGHIAILGFSQGARVMAEFLGKHPELSCAVSWSGTCHNGVGIYASVFDEFYDRATRNGFAAMPLTWRGDLHFSVDWFNELKNTSPVDSLRNYTAPVLAFSGVKDVIVPYTHANEIAAAGGNPESEVHIIPRADHTFNVFTGDDRDATFVLSKTVNWIKQHI